MAKIITPQTIKIGVFASAFLACKLSSSSPCVASDSNNAPPLNVKVVKLEDIEEEFDYVKREAKFAFRPPDLGSWNCTTSDWAVVVHFPGGTKTYQFQAWRDEIDRLQAGRAENVNKEIFEKATYFGTIQTSPGELLAKAKQLSTSEEYNKSVNNSQTWTRGFLRLVSPELLLSLYETIPATRPYCEN
ncbi:hypothetical protein DAPPUDRAFT_243747 [Daphnia pulex]|uniref:Uncharacterized protein n=1 Tax=Daphnia pulex TaxID=6669 RepID=E9GJK1_DAPPU|nr:hypothetical protein DAPPUDRAFT_243747 [Daphnia pulex]|eukprot:EFX80487.1 hypothetical protein DAPPUDRAFT_243747 [Daphnia pulex]